MVVVGKSLGTWAASYAAERGLDAIWFTPLLIEPRVAEAIAANAGRQLLVGGLVDGLWDVDIARELADNGCDVLEVPTPTTAWGSRATRCGPRRSTSRWRGPSRRSCQGSEASTPPRPERPLVVVDVDLHPL